MNDSRLVVPRLAALEVRGMTRGAFLLRSTLAAGAVYGGSVVGPLVGRALAQEGGSEGDVEILNFALTLEILEQTFYQEGLRQVSGLSGELASLVEELEANEAEHVDALTATIQDLGGQADQPPELDFGEAYSSEEAFLELAQTLEDTGVSAYNGAAPAIESDEVLSAAGSIVQIEARHAALVRLQRGEEPAPVAFDEARDEDQVLDEVQQFITGGNRGQG